MVIFGEFDQAGNPVEAGWEGLEANIDYLRSNVADPTDVGDGTRPATLTMPTGAVRSADIHVLGITAGATAAGTNQLTGTEGVALLATLEISIPDGVFS
jgi:hypothetical protein